MRYRGPLGRLLDPRRDCTRFAVWGEVKAETTIGSEVRNTRRAVAIDHVAEDATYCGHPTRALCDFQSYVSKPTVLKDGTFFGRLCGIDSTAAHLTAPGTIGSFRLFAELSDPV